MSDFEHEPLPNSFQLAPISPELAQAGETLRTDAQAALDWALANRDRLAQGVSANSVRESMDQLILPLDLTSPDDPGGFLIVHRDRLLEGIPHSQPTPQQPGGVIEAPFSVTHVVPGDQPNSWRRSTIILPKGGYPELLTSYEKERLVPPGVYVYKPIEAYSGGRATPDQVSGVQGVLAEQAIASGFPAELFGSK